MTTTKGILAMLATYLPSTAVLAVGEQACCIGQCLNESVLSDFIYFPMFQF